MLQSKDLKLSDDNDDDGDDSPSLTYWSDSLSIWLIGEPLICESEELEWPRGIEAGDWMTPLLSKWN